MKQTIMMLLMLCSLATFAQEFEVPKNFRPDKNTDYAAFNKDVIAAVDWLQKTPFNENREKRKDVSAFLIMWLTETPDVSVEVNTDVLDYGECSDCLMLFMGGWSKYVLETKDKTPLKGFTAGVRESMEYYKKNKKDIGKIKDFEKYIKEDEKGNLEAAIEAKLKARK